MTDVKLNVDWERFLAQHDLEWVVKPVSWDEGAFLGNGLLGAMVYGEENASKRHVLHFVTGRTDMTATRTDRPGFPPRVPIGELALELGGMIYHPTRLRVNLWNAELRGHLTTPCGEARFRALVHAQEPVLAVELHACAGEAGARFVWYAHGEVDRVMRLADGMNLNQFIPDAVVEKSARGAVELSVQRYATGEGCVAAWKIVDCGSGRSLCYLSVMNGCGSASIEEAIRSVESAAGRDWEEWVQTHRAWWHEYYRVSFVSIPDRRLESFYWIQMYKLASAARADSPLIDNQGPWLTSTPWPGVWFNMNVQMSYSPVYASGRLAIGESLVRAIEGNLNQLARNVPEPFRHDSLGLGRSCSYDLRSEVEDEIGNLTWVCHCIWRLYRHSMDDGLLRRVLYPVLRGSVNYYLHLLEEGNDGRLHLPPTVSPEYGSFMKTRVRDCHYDLALLRWGCETLLWSSERLDVDDPLAVRWRDVLDRLAELPVDDTGFMIGRDTPLAYGHRHFSHLLAVFPLHLVGPDCDEERELIEKSLRHWIDKEGDLRGFTMTGAASIAATLGWGDEARRFLQALLGMLKPNTMYKEAGPVIETPLAGAEAIHDMLLQSWGGLIRVFPAVPEDWKEAAFHDLRAEGAFLVSAVRREGVTSWIRIRSLAGEPCRVRTGWSAGIRGTAVDSEGRVVRTLRFDPGCDGRAGGTVELELKHGEEAVLYPDGSEPELVVRPVTEADGPVRGFGGPKPWRLFGFPFTKLS